MRGFYSRTRVHPPVTMPASARILGRRAGWRRLRTATAALNCSSIRRAPRGNPMSRSQFSRLSLCAAAIGALAITAFAVTPSRAAEDAVIIPAPAVDAQASDGIQTAVIAGGCFWGGQGGFQHTSGGVT